MVVFHATESLREISTNYIDVCSLHYVCCETHTANFVGTADGNGVT